MIIKTAKPLVNGEWLFENRETIPVQNPYSGDTVGEQAIATIEDVEQALQSAVAAKKETAELPAHERSTILKKAASLLEERKEEFAKLLSIELGKTVKNTRDEVARSLETLEQSAEEAKRLTGETIPGSPSTRGEHATAMTFRVPMGVIAAITPFNAPLNLMVHKIGPAFAGGNTIILKPAPQTPLIAAAFVELLLEAGYPRNAIQVVYGGVEIGQKIVEDPRTNLVSFTGGIKGGKDISNRSGMKKVLLELGGNAGTIVHEDADIERAATLCAKTGFSNSGQSCISVQRIYVHTAVLEKFSEILTAKVKSLKTGDPIDPETDVGTLVDEPAAQRVKSWVDEAKEQGANILTGGNINKASLEPTVIYKPKKQAKVVCEEVFGPVVSIIPYDDIDQALDEVNNSDTGLQAGIFSNSLSVIQKATNALDVGGVIINGTSNFRLDHWPYGGVKNSGIGREGPRFAIQEMTEMKMVVQLDR
ncbi:acyl-CoA reductase-like NAD-dependent aldehyde dehydrogenase [Geomicrobium halophilum]|uniref:Acyl-CoA reductase-like NAD-dependent aldehyde dehydrogenase n=1 Tax=Geomicrobium halophilum TaxID=549000 RepID=A0A841PTM3_9BACL|nr:aldehyde dehydrogenase family protein [Geomicrobium halophilum]MBB6450516.1 acyl-CoA reductase-like NAD-dependent aldehyde dehydrogenase [Geomicrobium halophilum]